MSEEQAIQQPVEHPILTPVQVIPFLVHEDESVRELAEESADSLWDRLVARAAEIDDKYYDEVDHRVSDRLIEAIARHPDLFADRVLAILNDDSIIDWREVWCADLAGRMRLRGAIDP